MRCRRALGALLTIFILAPLSALCTVCATDLCPMRTEVAPSHDAVELEGHCLGAPEELDLVAPDCCGGTISATTTATPGVPAQVLTSLALEPPVLIADPSPAPAFSFVDRGSEGLPPWIHVPLYTLHSSLLI